MQKYLIGPESAWGSIVTLVIKWLMSSSIFLMISADASQMALKDLAQMMTLSEELASEMLFSLSSP
jgi:hypothetical protein